MKKFFALLLAVIMCFSLCACGNNANANAGTELTLDNYEDYFDVNANISTGHTTLCEYKGAFVDLVKTLKCDITFKGNTNYEYNDVVFTVKFTHTGPSNLIDFYDEAIIKIKVNLAGNASDSCYVETPVAREDWDNISPTTYAFYRPSEISVTLGYSSYEIIDVTGTATKN